MTNKENQIDRHVATLLRIFPHAKYRDASLYTALRRIECKAHRDAERNCNGEMTERQVDRSDKVILRRLEDVLGPHADVPVFLNGDPRGYSLKIDDNWLRKNAPDCYRDWGGYGILAPDSFQ